MKKFIVFNNLTGKILRTGSCSDNNFLLQAQLNETVIEGEANDVTQKVVVTGYGEYEAPVMAITDKTQAEIDAEKPSEILPDDMPANITQGQLQSILNRLDMLESKIN